MFLRPSVSFNCLLIGFDAGKGNDKRRNWRITALINLTIHLIEYEDSVNADLSPFNSFIPLLPNAGFWFAVKAGAAFM